MTGTPDHILTSKRPENESDPYNKDKKWGSRNVDIVMADALASDNTRSAKRLKEHIERDKDNLAAILDYCDRISSIVERFGDSFEKYSADADYVLLSEEDVEKEISVGTD